MKNLQDKFPNFIEAMEYMKNGTDLKLVSSDADEIIYLMTFIILDKKLGNISAELKYFDGVGVVFSFSTLQGTITKTRTENRIIGYDLDVEEWLELIRETMIYHNESEDHQKILLTYSDNDRFKKPVKKSGCASIVLATSIMSLVLYLYLCN